VGVQTRLTVGKKFAINTTVSVVNYLASVWSGVKISLVYTSVILFRLKDNNQLDGIKHSVSFSILE